ncbi:Vanillate O-demethylase oxidoreductase [Burkholderia diffusa]|uniref:Vanillate O-demethylase oxidoreductase n=1 Tax=Burkholderia diffusa TaxID=488732 RepID=A0AAW3P9Q0_9BURK|nr:PDR/VanB family oxidoreductase [Burkholderia diffusa]KWF32785.1 Vanillate O-demethylase oxidoreductase [Burkholderia diffusa]KWF38708.1 Vanillate O-demethylase oxidoreductase [Burkholderia diffusa]KWF46753.1 Vanillate O-demethylase oxidoreductase [Burkholderia diffusa]KWF50677.1 Vanillate O-demethylase oxidoreductase [Burkholderia diffusa]
MTSDRLIVQVQRRVDEADGIISLELVDPAGNDLPPFDAGAHIEVDIEPGLTRHYSLCGSPSKRDRYVLGVLRESSSRGGSEAIHNRFHENLHVKISPPRNHFRIDESAEHSVLVAGGIGVTPLLSMAWRLHELGNSFELHYCVRSRTRAAFIETLKQSPFAEHVTLHCDDDENAPRLDMHALMKDPISNTHVYVCGPGGFINALIDTARDCGWRGENVHHEFFSAAICTSGTSFVVHAERSGLTVDVPEDKSIAQALLDAGVDVPLSCEQGVCGTCLTRVLEGVPEHNDLFLTQEERAVNNQMLLCCSRAQSSFLRLDI